MNLPASLVLVWDLRRAIERSQSLHIGIKRFNERGLQCKFSLQFQNWWNHFRVQHPLPNTKWTIHQCVLIQLIEKGLAGTAIYDHLIELDVQMINSCDDDIERHISLLPLILQIPLLGLLFPAILMLLLVPALKFLQL
jgi:hypothetical protein